MPDSRGWKSLQKEVQRLRSNFLPDPFSPTGIYKKPARVQANARAFVVLCHAEVECYLEEWAKNLGKKAEAAWLASATVTEPAAYFVSGLAKSTIPIPTTILDPNVNIRKRFADSLVACFTTFYGRVNDHNGIKEHNVAKIFGPLGVPDAAFTNDLITKLNRLGSTRGTHAHNSVNAAAVLHVLDPKTEYDEATQLVQELRIFDQELQKYRRSIR